MKKRVFIVFLVALFGIGIILYSNREALFKDKDKEKIEQVELTTEELKEKHKNFVNGIVNDIGSDKVSVTTYESQGTTYADLHINTPDKIIDGKKYLNSFFYFNEDSSFTMQSVYLYTNEEFLSGKEKLDIKETIFPKMYKYLDDVEPDYNKIQKELIDKVQEAVGLGEGYYTFGYNYEGRINMNVMVAAGAEDVLVTIKATNWNKKDNK